ncbi:hypothetical protein MASR2M78_24320 [Treponema sp.]
MIEVRVIVNNCYILREKIHEDAFFEWWRATAIFVASEFLIRFLKPVYQEDKLLLDRFIVQGRTCLSVSSPSLLDLVEVDRFNGRLFLVSEYRSYVSLHIVFTSSLRFSIEHACRLMLEIGEGIDTFHKYGMVHGALTSDAVVVRRSADRIEEIKLLQPSSSLFIPSIPDSDIQALCANWAYLAPELKRKLTADTRADIYSLGVMLFVLLIGKLPYGSRAGIRVRERSASPYHVVRAFARRALPPELALICTRALRTNPARRYQDAVSFIADLRSVLNKRCQASLKDAGIDPIAELATLNLQKAQAGAHEIVRSLDTVDYFRYLSEASLKGPGDIQSAMQKNLLEQYTQLLPELEAAEDEEAEADDDDDSIDTESYVHSAYAELLPGSIKAKSRPEPAKPEPDKPVPVPPVPAAPVKAIVDKVKLEPAAPGQAIAQKSEIQEVEAQFSQTKPPPSPVKWNHTGGTIDKIAAELQVLCRRAGRGRGSFRFIEEPGDASAAALLTRAFESLREGAFVVDLGQLKPGIKGEALLQLLEASLAQALMETDQAFRKRLKRRLLKADPEGYLRRGPLSLLIGSAKTDDDAELALEPIKIAAALRAFGLRRQPLVLLGRGVERIGKSAHELLMAVAQEGRQAPFCVFMFFIPGRVQTWHALSALNKD